MGGPPVVERVEQLSIDDVSCCRSSGISEEIFPKSPFFIKANQGTTSSDDEEGSILRSPRSEEDYAVEMSAAQSIASNASRDDVSLSRSAASGTRSGASGTRSGACGSRSGSGSGSGTRSGSSHSAQDFTESDEEGLGGYHRGGYHYVQIGEVYQRRYRIEAKLGWGHFSTVWIATDFRSTPPRYVALKFQKSAEHYRDAAYDEMELLRAITDTHARFEGDLKKLLTLLGSRAPSGRCTVEFLDYFTHLGPHGVHVCMVFEVMGANLLACLKQHQFRPVSGCGVQCADTPPYRTGTVVTVPAVQ